MSKNLDRSEKFIDLLSRSPFPIRLDISELLIFLRVGGFYYKILPKTNQLACQIHVIEYQVGDRLVVDWDLTKDLDDQSDSTIESLLRLIK